MFGGAELMCPMASAVTRYEHEHCRVVNSVQFGANRILVASKNSVEMSCCVDLQYIKIQESKNHVLYILKLSNEIIFVQGKTYKMVTDLPLGCKYKVEMKKFRFLMVANNNLKI